MLSNTGPPFSRSLYWLRLQRQRNRIHVNLSRHLTTMDETVPTSDSETHSAFWRENFNKRSNPFHNNKVLIHPPRRRHRRVLRFPPWGKIFADREPRYCYTLMEAEVPGYDEFCGNLEVTLVIFTDIRGPFFKQRSNTILRSNTIFGAPFRL